MTNFISSHSPPFFSSLGKRNQEGQESEETQIQKKTKEVATETFEMSVFSSFHSPPLSDLLEVLDPACILPELTYQMPITPVDYQNLSTEEILKIAKKHILEEQDLYEDICACLIPGKELKAIIDSAYKEAKNQLEWLFVDYLSKESNSREATELISVKFFQYMVYWQKHPSLYFGFLKLVKQYGPQLTLFASPLHPIFRNSFSNLFPNIEVLHVIDETRGEKIKWYLSPSLKSVTLEPLQEEGVDLSEFEKVKDCLKYIHLLGKNPEELEKLDEKEQNEKDDEIPFFIPSYEVKPFKNPQAMVALNSLSLRRAICREGLLANLAELPNLVYLNLENAGFEDLKELEVILQKHPKITLILNEVFYFKKKQEQYDAEDCEEMGYWTVYLLQKKYPESNIFSEHDEETLDPCCEDQTAFKALFSLAPLIKDSNEVRFGKEEAKTILEIGRRVHDLFSFQEAHYHSHLIRDLSCSPYDQNNLTDELGFFFSGSPIKLLDKRKYIATHAPAETKNKNTIKDFWIAAHRLQTNVIVMLTSCKERNTVMSPTYWPDDPNTAICIAERESRLRVTLESQEEMKACFDHKEKEEELLGYKRIFRLRDQKQNQDKWITQIHFTAWPDSTALPISKFNWLVNTVNDEEARFPNGSTMVHCAAGIGRTGTFLMGKLIDQGLKHHLAEKPAEFSNLQFNVKEAFIGLRQQRINLILTSSQLISTVDYFQWKKNELLKNLND